jgi:CRP-like cAMP-binding protein
MPDTHESDRGSILNPLIRRLETRAMLDDADRAAIRALPMKMRALEQHNYIVRERDRAEFSCVMLRGFSMRHKVVGTGDRQIVAIHMPGEIVDLQNSLLGVADHSVQMLTAGRAALIAREDIKRIAFDRPNVGLALWIDTLVDASIFREWIANVGRRDARTRIAHLLCEFSLRLKLAGLGDPTNYELPMTQEQLADTTGLTSVHVNRTIKSLEADKLIERIGPRSIVIGDWRKLAETGDFDSNYLHLQQSELVLQ